jgi:phospholipase/lecithinase/hemolysin
LYTVGRFTNGPDVTPGTAFQGVWHEQLAPLLGLPVAQPFLAGGTNFAFGGAETGFGFSPVGTPDLGFQISTFLTLSPSAPSNAVYVLLGGSNDILDAANAPGATAASVAAAEAQAIKNLDAEITLLAMSGAKDFLWFDLVPLNLLPEEVGNPLDAALPSASLQFQTDWLASLALLQSTLGVEIAGVDGYALYTQIQSTPAEFSLTNVTDSALLTGAADPDAYLYWDAIHPTTKGHNLIANAAFNSIEAKFGSTPEPSSACLLGLVVLPFGIYRSLKSRTTTERR